MSELAPTPTPCTCTGPCTCVNPCGVFVDGTKIWPPITGSTCPYRVDFYTAFTADPENPCPQKLLFRGIFCQKGLADLRDQITAMIGPPSAGSATGSAASSTVESIGLEDASIS